MSYVVRRRNGDQTAESDRLEGHLAAAWNEAISHLRSLDRKATDFTVYLAAEERDNLFLHNSISILLGAEEQLDLEEASRLFLALPSSHPGHWRIAWRTPGQPENFRSAESGEEVGIQFQVFLIQINAEAQIRRRHQQASKRAPRGLVPDSRFVLFLSTTPPEAAASQLKASGVRYAHKRLDSGQENWKSILAYLASPLLICVVGRLNSTIFRNLVSPDYEAVRTQLLQDLASVSHVFFVHESILTGIDSYSKSVDEDDGNEYRSGDDDDFLSYLRDSGYFDGPDDDVRSQVIRLFDENHINIVPYSTNAEYSVMAGSFIADNERNLLFRIYVPAGRLYAAEADKLISLFRDWLGRVRGHGVRQDGYETPAGHMYEFYGDGTTRPISFDKDFRDFSEFLDLCVDNPNTARQHLMLLGFDSGNGSSLVSRYAKEARRLQLDIKQEREQRVLAIQHRIENEVLEESINNGEVSSESVRALINGLVPAPGSQLAGVLEAASSTASLSAMNVQINQQIVNAVEGTVIQSIQGTVHLGAEAKQLLEIIGRHAGDDMANLESAVYELEDQDARKEDRINAKQRLKGFMVKVGSGLQDVAAAALVKYLDARLGL